MTTFIASAATWISANAATISTIATVASTAVSLISAGTSAAAQVQQGEARAVEYEAKAEVPIMQSRSEQIAAKQEATVHREAGTKALKKMRSDIAAVKARAAYGSLNPFTGSTGTLVNFNYAEGTDDYMTQVRNAVIASENAGVSEGAARYQRDLYRQAAVNARTGGYMGAAATGLEQGFQAFQAGAFRPAAAPVSSAGGYSHLSTIT